MEAATVRDLKIFQAQSLPGSESIKAIVQFGGVVAVFGKGKSLNVEMVYTQHSEVAQSYLKIAGSLMFPEECRKVKLQRVASEQELEEWSWLIHKETRAFRKDVHPAKWFSPLQSRSIWKRGGRSPELRWRLGHKTSVALRTKRCKLPKLQNSEQTSHRLALFPLQGRT